VVASPTFARSRQLKALLLYICRRTLVDEPAALTDVDIAAGVLGKGDFDAATGGLVRAQASILRKKLQHYFALEGAEEPVVLEVAMGTYLAVFHPRAVVALPSAAAVPPTRRALAGSAVVLFAALLLLSGTFWLGGLLARTRGAGGARPRAEQLWRQLFGNGRGTYLALSDATITLFQDIIGRQLEPGDYERNRLNGLMDEAGLSPEWRRVAFRSIEQRHTPMADVALTGRVQELQARLGLPTADVVLARDLTLRLFEGHNVILSGPRRANPWLALFEPQLNFRSRFDEATRVSSFENTAPRPGEPPVYRVEWGVRGYCRLAFLSGLDGRGTVLLISGTDMTSTEACTDFLTTEDSIERLRARLGVSGDAPLPHFEVLLGASVVVSSTYSAPELLAHRVLR
jgi:hypothetical protein